MCNLSCFCLFVCFFFCECTAAPIEPDVAHFNRVTTSRFVALSLRQTVGRLCIGHAKKTCWLKRVKSLAPHTHVCHLIPLSCEGVLSPKLYFPIKKTLNGGASWWYHVVYRLLQVAIDIPLHSLSHSVRDVPVTAFTLRKCCKQVEWK